MDKNFTDNFMKWTTKCTKVLLSFTVKKNFFSFLMKHGRIIDSCTFNLKSTGDVQVIIITFSDKI